jgi:hypothetical protein
LKILTTQELILLNQYVQGVVSRDEIDGWFLSLDEADKQAVVRNTWILAIQAQVREMDIPVAIVASELKSTHTPVVMLTKGNTSLHNRGYKLSTLKGAILTQAFLFVLECFVSAERRRKEKEGSSECHHWWHKDLSDREIVQEILRNHGSEIKL